MKDVLIAIPARGGSKRLPQKNIKLLCNKPMIVYTIEAALKANLGSVYVCTEDNQIEKISRTNGAKVFKIPEELAGDEVSSTIPCLELYKHLAAQGEGYKYVFNLQPTSPLRNADDITQSFEKMCSTQADFLVSTTPIDPHYFHWALQNNAGEWEMYFKTMYLKERTQLPLVYRPNGAIKIATSNALLQTGNFFGKPLETYTMPEERSIHVGSYFDFVCCEAILTKKIK